MASECEAIQRDARKQLDELRGQRARLWPQRGDEEVFAEVVDIQRAIVAACRALEQVEAQP